MADNSKKADTSVNKKKEKTNRTPKEIIAINEKNRFDNLGKYYKTKKRFIN